MRTSAGLNVGAGGASAVSGSQTASDTAATTTRANKPSKIRRSIVGPFVADPRASVTALPADGKRLICGRWAARQVRKISRKGAKARRGSANREAAFPCTPRPAAMLEDKGSGGPSHLLRAFAPLREIYSSTRLSAPNLPPLVLHNGNTIFIINNRDFVHETRKLQHPPQGLNP